MVNPLVTSTRLLASTLVLLATCMLGAITARAQTPTVITSLPYVVTIRGT